MNEWMCPKCCTVNSYIDSDNCSKCGYKISFPKIKCELKISVVEEINGKTSIEFNFNEEDTTMKDIGLLLYNLKKFEQELIDREWDGTDSYEIEGSAGDEDEM